MNVDVQRIIMDVVAVLGVLWVIATILMVAAASRTSR
jgi:hypothetical protein